MITVKNLVRLHHIIAVNIEKKMECKLGEITFKSNLSPTAGAYRKMCELYSRIAWCYILVSWRFFYCQNHRP